MISRQIHIAINLLIALVWLVNGIYCKILDAVPRHRQIIDNILGAEYGEIMTNAIGFSEILMALWILSGFKRRLNTFCQITVIMLMNILEYILTPELLLWGRWNILFAAAFCILIYFNYWMNTKIKNYELYT